LAELVDLADERRGRGARAVVRDRKVALKRRHAPVELGDVAAEVGGAAREVRDLRADIVAIAGAAGDLVEHREAGQSRDRHDGGFHAGEAEPQEGDGADRAGDQRHAECDENGAQAPHAQPQDGLPMARFRFRLPDRNATQASANRIHARAR
jgi:hypothetical protein